MLTPVESAGQGLIKACLVIQHPLVDDPIIPLHFNPTEYSVQKSNNFAEIAIPGLESPPIQFVRGAAETLSVELLVDTSDSLEDVRSKYVNRLRGLLNINSEMHAPPILLFVWDTSVFRGVLESLNIQYVMFTPEGVPLRARLSVKLKEYRPVKIQVSESPRHSPDVEKGYTVRRGDTLSGIASGLYRDAELWREIARHNGIRDPRKLAPGLRLTIPALTSRGQARLV